jgi:hypothetical protein
VAQRISGGIEGKPTLAKCSQNPNQRDIGIRISLVGNQTRLNQL